ncbi:MAG: beta-galactosidase [Abditibacteriaceae bacterium]
MTKSTFIAIAIFLISSVAHAAAPPILDPNLTLFPRSSLHDFSDLVPDAPANRGFLQSRDGHFYWQDGTRARFWGINVANHTLMVPDAQIIAMVKNFRQAGFNLIRLHHFDERNGIIDMTRADSQHIIEERLRKLDFWIYQAHLNGISIYLDLLDYRQFKNGDDVPNADAIGRAARPYAVFDPRLIELQKEYAKVLLTHVNPYTKLAYVNDPTVVMLEIYDESGLLMRRAVWREMPKPYNTQFRKMWNYWLKARYKSTSGLRVAWGDALGANESLENDTVELPLMTWTPQSAPESQLIYAALPRRNDGARFAVEVHQKFFQEMLDYLHGIGVKIPISVTGRFDDLADMKSMSSKLDFIGANFYYDHPYWGVGKPAWQLPSYYRNDNPLKDTDEHSFAATIGLAKIHNKPLVVREWNYCWPNPWRGEGMLEAAAYADFQDIDAMILFTYETSTTARVSYFNVRSDPARWGMLGIAAQLFLKQIIPPSKYRVIIPYSDQDTFTYTPYYQPLYSLGWFVGIENDFYDTQYQAPNKSALLVSPGRNDNESMSGAPMVLWQQGDHSVNPTWDMQNKIANLGNTSSRQALAGSLNALQQFFGAPFSWKVLLDGKFVSDGGRLKRDVKTGTQFINTLQLQAVTGNLGDEVRSGDLKVRGLAQGTLAFLSLDGLPIGQSQRFVIKMVTEARNVDQVVKPDPRFPHRPSGAPPGQWMVETYGKGPVTEDGQPNAKPIEVWRGNQLLLKTYQSGGSFELLMQNGHWRFYCDTSGVRFAVYQSVIDSKANVPHGKTKSINLQEMSPDGKLKVLSGLQQENAVIARFPMKAAYVQF